jgi:uncharacterized low-complexity protein
MSNRKTSKTTIVSAAVGGAFAASLGAAPLATAADNPFAMQPLDRGYQVAEAGKMGSGKCGAGKCGAAMRKDTHAMCGMAMMDENKDGKVSKEEFIKAHEAMFDKLDTNKDGVLDKAEMAKMPQGMCGGAKAGEGKCGGAKAKMGDGKCGAMK